MGRLSPLTAALALTAWSACKSPQDPAPASARSEQVLAAGSAPAAALLAPIEASTPPAQETAPPRPRKLCEAGGNAKGRVVPKTPASHAEAPGAPRLEGIAQGASGEWTWINFWAAWCGPCKEEMPRLLSWRDRLASASTPVQLVFVSLDDDGRQLDAFLAAQPPGGVRSTLWLPDGPTRADWLKSLRINSAPELPEQAFISPSGRVRCFVEGAVDEGDYAEIAALVAER